MIRLFIPHDLAAGAELALDHGQSHYLASVMRQGVGDELLLFNGRDGEWRARIAAVTRRAVGVRAETLARPQATGPDLMLVIALVKRARLETIVEKAAELGVRSIQLMTTDRTNADRARVDRLSAIAIEASEQTGRLDVPQIHEPMKLGALIGRGPGAFGGSVEPPKAQDSRLKIDHSSSGNRTSLSDEWSGRHILFCDEAGDAKPVLEVLSARRPEEPWAIFVGPEGGFSPAERANLRALPSATPASLGPRILRADTAAISALTLWQAALGDWR